MAFSRKQMVAAVAGTLSLAVLTGCPAATAPTPPTGSASAAPSAAPTTAPTTAPSAAASAGASAAPTTAPSSDASPGASTAPSASAPVPSGKTVIVSGNVYAEDGATIDDALITVKSLDASVPYTATATTNGGSWVVNNVPEGANVEIVATRDGYTSRRRVGSFQQQATGKRNIINFGAAGGNADNEDEDPTGEAYFISDFPEVVSVSPTDEETGVDSAKTTYKLTFSEPLTEDSREAFEDAFFIVPNNNEAGGPGSNVTDLKAGEDDDEDDNIASTFDADDSTDVPYSLAENDSFLGSSRTKMTSSWNSEGTEVTFTFNGALLADDNDGAEYAVVLMSQGDNDKIEDEDKNQLGTDSTGNLDDYPAADTPIYNAFKETDLALGDTGLTDVGDENWASTHDTVAMFEVREDETDPALKSVNLTEEGNDVRIELEFTEIMAAYDGTNVGFIGNGLYNLENYTFAVGQDNGDLSDVDLEGDADVEILNPVGDDSFGDNGDTIGFEEEFMFSSAALESTTADIDTLDTASTGQIVMELDADNPTTMFIWIANINDYFDGVAELKARVEDVEDPAGNGISETDADANVKDVSI